MSTMAAAMPNKLRVLPGSVDLLIAYPSYEASTESAGGSSASAVAWLNSSLQLARSIPSELLSASAVSLPPSVSAPLWQYEQLRSILCDLNALLASLAPHCTAAVCPVMVATADWEFLCAAHGSKPLKCSAMAYMCHTLTSFASLLSDSELFPNRSAVSDKAAAVFPSVCRRLYRIFAHAAHHHTALFQQWETQHRTCSRFLQLIEQFQLMDQQQRTPHITLTQL